MKAVFTAAVVAAFATGAVANAHHGHNHLFAHKRGDYGETCTPGCTTVYHTMTGKPTWVPNPPVKTSIPPPPPPPPSSSAAAPPTTSEHPLPTPQPEVCPTPGTYTFTPTTITVTQETTVCGATSTAVPSGTHTYGGTTTVVTEATTVTCPYATVQTSGTVTTSTILSTTYVCPSAGTYTPVPPSTTTVTKDTTIVYPCPTTISTGTYTRPATVVTVTETDYTTWCPYETVKPTPAAPAPKPKPAAPKPKPAAPKPAAPAPSSGYGSQPSGGSSAGTGSNGHYGLTYTPYDNDTGACKSAEAVDADIKALAAAGFDTVRTYSTDCSTLQNVGAACEAHGMKMIIGIFVKDSCDSQNTLQQVAAIKAWAKWDIVKLFVVGNEVMLNGLCSASELKTLITTVKEECSGYKGDYTVAETLNVWQGQGVAEALCPELQIVGSNIHPYFNAAISPSQAGTFVKSQLDLLSDICPGKDVLNLECGWPTAGKANGLARPGVAEQKQALDSIRSECGDKVVFFSFKNDYWKQPGECECEQNWGSASFFSD